MWIEFEPMSMAARREAGAPPVGEALAGRTTGTGSAPRGTERGWTTSAGLTPPIVARPAGSVLSGRPGVPIRSAIPRAVLLDTREGRAPGRGLVTRLSRGPSAAVWQDSS